MVVCYDIHVHSIQKLLELQVRDSIQVVFGCILEVAVALQTCPTTSGTLRVEFNSDFQSFQIVKSPRHFPRQAFPASWSVNDGHIRASSLVPGL